MFIQFLSDEWDSNSHLMVPKTIASASWATIRSNVVRNPRLEPGNSALSERRVNQLHQTRIKTKRSAVDQFFTWLSPASKVAIKN